MPYRHQQYENPYAGSISDILGRKAAIRAQAALQSGDAQARAAEMSGQGKMQMAGAIANGAQQVVGGLRDIAQFKAEAPQRALQQREFEARVKAAEIRNYTEEEKVKLQSVFQAVIRKNTTEGGVNHQGVIDEFTRLGPEGMAVAKLYKDLNAQAAPPADYTMNPGDVRFRGGTGEQIASVPKPEPIVEEKLHPVTVPGPNGRPVRKMFTEAQLAQGVEEYRVPNATSPARFWVMRNGTPIRVTEAEYQRGDTPASTREQGRPVISGDANQLADFDNSLDDLGVLRAAIGASGSTGVQAQIGAALPPWVTDITGWGTDAKKKQALIDRVKQVIGKTLEEGVLRKEDELKYEKILPTIKDPNAIVISKLTGLEQAIAKRKGRQLDALEDSGYDVAKFRARGAIGAPADTNTAVVVQAPNGTNYTFPNAKAADEFKRAAGIP